MLNTNDWDSVYKREKVQEYSKWRQEIPYISFPSDWEVKIIPPFAGAVVRFLIKKGEATVSVYLDCYDMLGFFGEPYWEIYPYEDDVYRCAMNETDDLLEKIGYSLYGQLNEKVG